jgi:hypothetical protein
MTKVTQLSAKAHPHETLKWAQSTTLLEFIEKIVQEAVLFRLIDAFSVYVERAVPGIPFMQRLL